MPTSSERHAGAAKGSAPLGNVLPGDSLLLVDRLLSDECNGDQVQAAEGDGWPKNALALGPIAQPRRRYETRSEALGSMNPVVIASYRMHSHAARR